MGITFKTGVDIGKDIPMADLRGRFDAVFVAGGTWKALSLGVPGEESGGIHYALDYLKRINSGEKVRLGKRVVVIGGGSVAVDAARVALRTGAQEVHLVCLECRDLSSRDRMLALESEIDDAEKEGVIIHPSLGIREIVTKNGKAIGIEAVTCLSVREPDGSFNPQYDNTCVASTLETDSIIVAIGQGVDQSLSAPGLGYSERGVMEVDKATLETGAKGVYAGGDIVTGATTVIQAIASAREAVLAMELSLRGGVPAAAEARRAAGFRDSVFRDIPRARERVLSVSERVKTIGVEDVLGLDMREIETEANRCFNCGCLAVGPSDIAMALVALEAFIVTSKRRVPAAVFFSARATKSTSPRHGRTYKGGRCSDASGRDRSAVREIHLETPHRFCPRERCCRRER